MMKIILFFGLIVCVSTLSIRNENKLLISPKDPYVLVGTNVTIECAYNATPVQCTWNRISNGESRDSFNLTQYNVINITENTNIQCKDVNGNVNRTDIQVREKVKPAKIKCTSFTNSEYKCEWERQDNAINYTFESRQNGTDEWFRKYPKIQHTNIEVGYIGSANEIQEIRVNTSNKVSNVSKHEYFDVPGNLKPNNTYRGAKMTKTSAVLHWHTGNIIGTNVEIDFKNETYFSDEQKITKEIEYNMTTCIVNVSVNGLKPGRNYGFGIRSRYADKPFSEWTYVNETTKDSEPSEGVDDFEIISYEDGSYIKWSDIPKENRNGDILGYKLYFKNSKHVVSLANVSSTESKFSLQGSKYHEYEYVCVKGYNNAGDSPPKCFHIESEVPVVFKQTIIWICVSISVVLLVIASVAFVYDNVNRIHIFMKWPDPNFTTITFNGISVNSPEPEVFDKLRNVNERSITETNSGTSILNNYITDQPDLNDITNNLDLTENTRELVFPNDYHLVSEVKQKPPVRLNSQTNDYLQIGTSMCPPFETETKNNCIQIGNMEFRKISHEQLQMLRDSKQTIHHHITCSTTNSKDAWNHGGYISMHGT